MKRRRWPWLLGAALLVGLAALLMRVGEDDPHSKPTWARLEIPRRANQADKDRMAQRQVLEPVAPPAAQPGQPAPPPRPRDPVLAALGGPFKKGAFVLEANAVRNSPMGQLLVDCLTSSDNGQGLQRMRERSGIDPLTQIDRIAISDDMLILTGDFKGLKTENLKGRPAGQFGESAQMFDMLNADGGVGGALGLWGDSLIASADDPETLKQTFERIEGKRPMESGGLSDAQAYGEMYGVLSPDMLAGLIGDENPELAERVGQVAQRVELHVDTSGDVGVAARVEATNAADAKEVSKALGSAMSLARLKFKADGKDEVADLLDMSRVVSDGSAFRLETGVPQAWIEKALKKCVERNRERREKAAQAPKEATGSGPVAPPEVAPKPE